MDISFENQSTAIFNIVIDDSDSTFYQGYILYDDKKYYFLTKEAEVKISGLHSSTTYQAKLYIESLNGTSNMHKDEYILSSFTTPEAKYPDDFTVDLKKYVLTIGEKTSTIITSTPDNVYTTYTYSSSDETIVTVNSDGRVTAVGEGICTIYVTSKQGITRSIDIEVEAISTSEQTEKTKKCGKKSFGELIALTTTLSMLIYILRKKN
jgi:hypothetical protein